MELIKKTILQALTTGATTGSTKTGDYIIIPDKKAVYHMKVGLKSTVKDIGFFDVDLSSISYPLVNPTTIPTITGSSSSRLPELRKYTITNVFTKQYISGGTVNHDGVDMLNSNPLDKIIYYLGKIMYVDIISGDSSGITYNVYKPEGFTSANFINVPYYKNPNKENIISNPKINDDVFIVRQELSAFDKNFRLEYIRNFADLSTYAGGNFFKIVSNT